MRFPSKGGSKDRKKAIERKRVKNIGEVYTALANLLGMDLKKLNKVAILEAAVKFIKEHHHDVDIPDPLMELRDEEMPVNLTNLKISAEKPQPTPASPQGIKAEEMSADEEPLGPVVVNVGGVVSCYSPPTTETPPPLTSDAPMVSLPSSSCSKDDDALLLCFEEVSYQDESTDDSIKIKEENMSSESQQPHSVVVTDTDSSFGQYYGCVSSVPNNSMLFSPSTPWLTSTSPQIASAFATSFSPPMQPQATPKLHHLSPPSSCNLTSMYSPFPNSFPNSPLFLPMYNYDESGEPHWVPGDVVIQQ